MSDGAHVTTTNNDLYDRLDRIEDKLDLRLNTLDAKVDLVASRIDRMEGALGMLKWLGPTGVAAVGYALLKGAGYL
jgi:hypothetical protein